MKLGSELVSALVISLLFSFKVLAFPWSLCLQLNVQSQTAHDVTKFQDQRTDQSGIGQW